MILYIDEEIRHSVLIMIPDEKYHSNKKGFKELRTHYGFTNWYRCSWTDEMNGKIETHFRKRYDTVNNFFSFDGDVLIINSTNGEFVGRAMAFWNMRGASIIDMTDNPKIEVLVNGVSVRHEVIE